MLPQGLSSNECPAGQSWLAKDFASSLLACTYHDDRCFLIQGHIDAPTTVFLLIRTEESGQATQEEKLQAELDTKALQGQQSNDLARVLS